MGLVNPERSAGSIAVWTFVAVLLFLLLLFAVHLFFNIELLQSENIGAIL